MSSLSLDTEGDGNLHTLQGPHPRHRWWLQHPWLMPRPSHWRFNNCYNLTTHRQKESPHLQPCICRCTSKHHGGPGPVFGQVPRVP